MPRECANIASKTTNRSVSYDKCNRKTLRKDIQIPCRMWCKTNNFRLKFDAKSTKNASGGPPKHQKAPTEQPNQFFFRFFGAPGPKHYYDFTPFWDQNSRKMRSKKHSKNGSLRKSSFWRQSLAFWGSGRRFPSILPPKTPPRSLDFRCFFVKTCFSQNRAIFRRFFETTCAKTVRKKKNVTFTKHCKNWYETNFFIFCFLFFQIENAQKLLWK